MTKRIIVYGGMLLAIVVYVSCSNGGFARLLSRGGVNEPSDTTINPPIIETPPQVCLLPNGDPCAEPTTEPTEPPTSSRTDSWTQPTDMRRPVDIIFVVDTSESLSEERPYVTTALEGFLPELEAEGITDYCIGVMPAHGGTYAGALRAYGTNAKCLCAGESNLISKFSQNFATGLPSDDGDHTDGGEVGLYSVNKALTDTSKIAAIKTTGCFRDSAAFVPIFMADENDISTSINVPVGEGKDGCHTNYPFDPVGPDTVIDPNCEEAQGRMKYHSDAEGKLTLSYQDVYAAGLSFQGSLPFVAGVLGYTNTYPKDDENGPPTGYSELVGLTDGIEVDLALATAGNQTGFNASFAGLKDIVTVAATLNTVFDLSAKPCAGSILVKVDDVSVSFTWNGVQRVTISRTKPGEAGSIIEISYNVCA